MSVSSRYLNSRATYLSHFEDCQLDFFGSCRTNLVIGLSAGLRIGGREEAMP